MDYKALALKVGGMMNNYSHTTIGTAYAGALALYWMKTGHDVPSGLVTFSGYFYGFLLGHAAAYQKWPDQPQQ